MLSKEQGVMAIGMCAGFDILLHWNTVWSMLVYKSKIESKTESSTHVNSTEGTNGTTHAVLENGGSRVSNGNIVVKKGGKGKHDLKEKEHKIYKQKREILIRIGISLYQKHPL